jgi:hypothetical protein
MNGYLLDCFCFTDKNMYRRCIDVIILLCQTRFQEPDCNDLSFITRRVCILYILHSIETKLNEQWHCSGARKFIMCWNCSELGFKKI